MSTIKVNRGSIILLAIVLLLGAFWVIQLRPRATSNSAAPQPQAQATASPEETKPAQGTQPTSSSKAHSSPSRSTALASQARQSPLAPVPGKTYPITNLGTEFSTLAEKAQSGDVIAARTLSQALQVCAHVPKTFEELDSATATANSPNLAPNWAAILQNGLEDKRRLFNQCAGTTADEVATQGKWLGLLAAAGDSTARLEYVSGSRPTDFMAADYDQRLAQFKQNAAQYIQDEISSGNPAGLLTMGLQYYDSPVKIDGVVPLYSSDNTKAYSYFYAYSLADSSNQSVISILASLQNQLSAAQIQEATGTGTAIFNQCCSHTH